MGAPWLTAALSAVESSLGALGLLVEVEHYAWIGTLDDYQAPDYDQPVTLQAQVQLGSNQVRELQGETFLPRACLSFFTPIAPNGMVGRMEPIDPRDKFVFEVDGVEYEGAPIVDNVGSQVISDGSSPAIATRPVLVVWLK